MITGQVYRIEPSPEQSALLKRYAGMMRFVWNNTLGHIQYLWENKVVHKMLEDGREVYYPGFSVLCRRLPVLKDEFPWLKEAPSQALQYTLKSLDKAQWAAMKDEKGFLNFKSRNRKDMAVHFPQGVILDKEQRQVRFPKLGWMKVRLHRGFRGSFTSASVQSDASGAWYVSFCVNDGQDAPVVNVTLNNIDQKNFVGVDVGIKTLITLSDQRSLRHLNMDHHIGKIKYYQRKLSLLRDKHIKAFKQKIYGPFTLEYSVDELCEHVKPDSIKMRFFRRMLARMHEKVARRRLYTLHVASKTLVKEFDGIFVETLNIQGMAKNRCLAKYIYDMAWGKFYELCKYKAERAGKLFFRIDRFAPSSKMCNSCKEIKRDLTLKDRKWTCSSCHTPHDRDENAAMNIRDMGIEAYKEFLMAGTKTHSAKRPSKQRMSKKAPSEKSRSGADRFQNVATGGKERDSVIALPSVACMASTADMLPTHLLERKKTIQE